ncbi:primosomal protein N [Gottschalkia purinilytica]|uniref:Replication restart protein PriA n=1 Tax=Gottschalkia purinilytica TaxID=1503 RepID=A0A0L0WBC9_GOTPU|nr:primosomal protein N' [Gottschalkia purinilytica]KNF08737.1 primosomal protein N [Gottschalkia purinilytica]
MKMELYAEIIIDNMSVNTDRLYTYLIPEKYINKAKKGMRVLVPFGMGNKTIEGVIVNITDKIQFESSKVKSIKHFIDEIPILSENMIELIKWMKDKYLCRYIEVLKTVIPTGIMNKSKKYVKLVENIENERLNSITSKNQKNILIYLQEHGEIELQTLSQELQIKNILSSIDALNKKNLIEVIEKVGQEVNKKYVKYVYRNFSKENLQSIINTLSKNAIKQIDILKFITNIDCIPLKELIEKTNSNLSSINSLKKKEYLKILEKEETRNAITRDISTYKKFKLTNQQESCVNTIYDDFLNKENNKYLLHGVTGSGKTEVYLQIIEKILELGKETIVLVPEISLTPQTVERFVGRFGDKVAVLHSRLSLGERYDEWRKIKEKKVKIVVGARSAIFAPFENLGLIIIDEEHETSYKSSMNPKYSAIEVAEKRCNIEGATLILGSATPDIESYYRAKKGELKLLTLPNRINNKKLPHIEIVDMRTELHNGNKSIFSKKLYEEIYNNLKNKNQTILFLNRRGFSTFVSCRECGYVAKCENCDISLTYHASLNRLICHYCGTTMTLPSLCPECKSKYIRHFGIGTQKVEEMIKKYFPEARVARMDIDTTTKKGSHERILDTFKKGKVDILIGTQMISKGLDFPNVTLVGIIIADTSLNLPDFKSPERTFQLLTQVGGRAGRSDLEGRVILQTYEPEHYSILTAKTHDYNSFYDKEILLRKEFGYPPFKDIISIVISSEKEEKAFNMAKNLFDSIISNMKSETGKEFPKEKILGPNQALIYKLKNKFRWQIILKCEKWELDRVKCIIDKVCTKGRKNLENDIKINIDINPISIV